MVSMSVINKIVRHTDGKRPGQRLSAFRPTTGDESQGMCVVVEPAVTSNLEQVGTFTWVGNQYPSQDIPSVWGDVFGKGERSRDYVLVEQVDIIAFGISRVVIKWQVSGQHCVLNISVVKTLKHKT